MTEIGGSATDVSIPNLETPENSPSTSNEQQKGSSLKRPALADDKPRSPVKKKKTAEEIASSVRGRNQEIKKLLKKEKEKKRKKHKPVCDIKELEDHRERLMAKIDVLEQRDMLMNMKAEEKMIKKEEKLKKALADIDRIIKKARQNSEPIEQNEVPKVLSIHIPDWPCLDPYVQDFAFDRLDFLRERGISMTEADLTDIINKVKSRDASVKFPSDIDRLLVAVNNRIGEAVHERRFENLMKNIVEYPTVDAKEVEGFETLEGTLAILKVVKKEGEAERQELQERVGRILHAVGEAKEGASKEVDVIELDDEDDEEKECDEDELDEEDEDDEDEDDESDQELYTTLNKYRASEKKGVDSMEEESEDHEVSDQPELPEMIGEEEETEEAEQPELIEEPIGEIAEEETNADAVPMEEYDVVEEVVEGENEEIEQVEQTDSIAEKTIEETTESMEVKEIMEAQPVLPTKWKDERPDSREGKEVMEGGTSTNSPTVERDERMKELDKTSDVKETGPNNDASSDDEVEVLDEINYDNRPGPRNPQEFKTNDGGATIVLDDDDEESIAERRKLRAQVDDIPKSELPKSPKLSPLKEEDYIGPPDHPPVAPRMSHLEAWRRKVEEIQAWVDSSTTDPEEIDMDIQKVVAPVATSYDDDEEIKCLIDDFEMDSVSHSGLKLRMQRKEGDEKEEGAGPSVSPSPPTDTPKEKEMSMKKETVQREVDVVSTTGNDSIIMLD